MKTIWTPGQVELHKPDKFHLIMIWTLWGITVALLSLWMWGMTTQYFKDGWIHALLAGTIVMAGVCTVYGFKYCAYYQRPLIKRIRNAKFLRSRKP